MGLVLATVACSANCLAEAQFFKMILVCTAGFITPCLWCTVASMQHTFRDWSYAVFCCCMTSVAPGHKACEKRGLTHV